MKRVALKVNHIGDDKSNNLVNLNHFKLKISSLSSGHLKFHHYFKLTLRKI